MPPSTAWNENVAADEVARFTEYAVRLRDLQREQAKAGSPDRALHAKGNAGVLAELTVLPDLPEHTRHGIFAAPATYPAYVRFSNGVGKRQADRAGDVRGVAVKVVGVAGKKIIPGMQDAKTQDLLLIRSPATPFRNAAEFIAVVTAAAGNPLLLLPRILGRLGIGRTLAILGQLPKGLNTPIVSLATTRYFSAVPVTAGPYAIHYALIPHAKDSGDEQRGNSRDYLGEELGARLAKGPVVYDVAVQFFVDEAKTPIEDASVEWKEADAPFVTVGRLTLLQQNVGSARGRKVADYIERLSFDPWHALEAHRPLGDIMRARNHAYRLSTQERKAAGEPDGTETFD